MTRSILRSLAFAVGLSVSGGRRAGVAVHVLCAGRFLIVFRHLNCSGAVRRRRGETIITKPVLVDERSRTHADRVRRAAVTYAAGGMSTR